MEALIYVAIAVLWLAYLVPTVLRRQKVVAQPTIEPFGDSARLIPQSLIGRRVDDAEATQPLEGVSRAVRLRALHQLEVTAARRRRRVLLSLLVATTLLVVAVVAGFLPWWTVAVPGGLVVAFLVASRISVVIMQRDLDQRREALLAAPDHEFGEQAQSGNQPEEHAGASVDGVALGHPRDEADLLWQPLPITAPTYVSRPVNGRSVRTIDLSTPASAPAATDAQARPVTGDEPTAAIPRTGSTAVDVEPAAADHGSDEIERPLASGE